MAQKDEPSMEDILSSIKRIIAEDGDAAPAPRRERAPEPEPDVLELDEFVAEPPPPAEDASVEEAPAIATAPVAPPVVATDALISRTTAMATREALASLSKMVVRPEAPVADNTLEGLVRELLRPMLKDWLDANLPRIVQATVDREVARIAGR